MVSTRERRERILPSQSTESTALDFESAYEIIIADNGSTDGSQEIAERAGVRVVSISQRGYGAALLGGIAAARGKYIVMGDADCSYDFGEIPKFVAKLEEGFDLVMGNRFAGEIKPGAIGIACHFHLKAGLNLLRPVLAASSSAMIRRIAFFSPESDRLAPHR